VFLSHPQRAISPHNGRARAIVAPLALEELMIVFQSALIAIAEGQGRSTKWCVARPGTSGIQPRRSSGSIALMPQPVGGRRRVQRSGRQRFIPLIGTRKEND
jgi:hypothetical protein